MMSRATTALLALALTVASAADFAARTYTADLETDPYERWKPDADDLLSKHGYKHA